MASFGGDQSPVPAGTVSTSSGTSSPVNLGNRNQFRGQLVVTAASGTTPSLTATLQTSHDAGATDPWRNVGAFPAATAPGSSPWQNFGPLDRTVRISYVISGTSPSFTWGVVGEAL